MVTLNYLDQTVGEMVAEDYRKAEVFKNFGIDFCCGGKVPLNDICKKKGISVEEVQEALANLDKVENQSHDFNSWELDFLVEYIKNTHHKYVNSAIPVLYEYSQKVAKVHGEHHPEVVEIAKLFIETAEELRLHMHKEEAILFPCVKELVQAHKGGNKPTYPFGSIANPIQMMESEHESAGGNVEKIRQLSYNYTPPGEACNTFRVLYAKLEEFENDLHQHVHLENNILFPKIIKMEEELK